MAANFALETSSSSSSPKKKKRKHHCHPPVVIPDSQLKSSASTEIDKKPPRLWPSLQKYISYSQPTTSDALLKFLQRSTCGVKLSLTNAHVSDSSDSNSLDIPHAQPEKYNVNNPEDANTLDPNDGDINSGRIQQGNNLQNINSSSDINKEGEVIMEYQFPQTQQEQIDEKRNNINDPPTTAKPSTMGTYSLVADSLRLSTV